LVCPKAICLQWEQLVSVVEHVNEITNRPSWGSRLAKAKSSTNQGRDPHPVDPGINPFDARHNARGAGSRSRCAADWPINSTRSNRGSSNIHQGSLRGGTRTTSTLCYS